MHLGVFAKRATNQQTNMGKPRTPEPRKPASRVPRKPAPRTGGIKSNPSERGFNPSLIVAAAALVGGSMLDLAERQGFGECFCGVSPGDKRHVFMQQVLAMIMNTPEGLTYHLAPELIDAMQGTFRGSAAACKDAVSAMIGKPETLLKQLTQKRGTSVSATVCAALITVVAAYNASLAVLAAGKNWRAFVAKINDSDLIARVVRLIKRRPSVTMITTKPAAVGSDVLPGTVNSTRAGAELTILPGDCVEIMRRNMPTGACQGGRTVAAVVPGEGSAASVQLSGPLAVPVPPGSIVTIKPAAVPDSVLQAPVEDVATLVPSYPDYQASADRAGGAGYFRTLTATTNREDEARTLDLT